jgi:hypothetical protein
MSGILSRPFREKPGHAAYDQPTTNCASFQHKIQIIVGIVPIMLLQSRAAVSDSYLCVPVTFGMWTEKGSSQYTHVCARRFK